MSTSYDDGNISVAETCLTVNMIASDASLEILKDLLAV